MTSSLKYFRIFPKSYVDQQRKNKTKEAKKNVIFICRFFNYSFFIQLIPENDFALNEETNLDSAQTEKFKLWLWKV